MVHSNDSTASMGMLNAQTCCLGIVPHEVPVVERNMRKASPAQRALIHPLTSTKQMRKQPASLRSTTPGPSFSSIPAMLPHVAHMRRQRHPPFMPAQGIGRGPWLPGRLHSSSASKNMPVGGMQTSKCSGDETLYISSLLMLGGGKDACVTEHPRTCTYFLGGVFPPIQAHLNHCKYPCDAHASNHME